MKQKPAPAAPGRSNIRRSRFPHQIFIESYGVKVSIAVSDLAGKNEILAMLPGILADRFALIDETEADHEFHYAWNASGRDTFYKNCETETTRRPRDIVLDNFNSSLRLTVAEYAVDRVFLHAGVVSWKGKAIVMPAKSFKGKSTLTAELVRRGALYYSDEYAVLDSDGLVSPFPKMLSIRGEIDDHTQIDHPVETFGGTAGTEPVPVGMVLLTNFKPNAKWNPRILTSGKGLMEIIRDTIPIRKEPTFTLAVLNKVAKTAKIVSSPRGEAPDAAARILDFFETECLSS